jgi:hypothetical protein
MRSTENPAARTATILFSGMRNSLDGYYSLLVGPADQIPLLDSESHLFKKSFILKQSQRKRLQTDSVDCIGRDEVHGISRMRKRGL